jgi:hypothetical protein
VESFRQSTDKHAGFGSGGVRYRFSRERKTVALALLWVGLGSSVLSIVCYVTRDRNELIYVSLCLTAVGVVSLYHGLRDLMGHLTVDESGVRVWPSCFGPSLDWRSIKRWRVEAPKEGTDDDFETCLVVSLQGRWLSRRLPASMAAAPGFDQLVKEFRRRAGSREAVDLA